MLASCRRRFVGPCAAFVPSSYSCTRPCTRTALRAVSTWYYGREVLDAQVRLNILLYYQHSFMLLVCTLRRCLHLFSQWRTELTLVLTFRRESLILFLRVPTDVTVQRKEHMHMYSRWQRSFIYSHLMGASTAPPHES